VSRRRSVGEGSVYEDATRGRWLGSLTLPNGQRKRVVAKNRTEARQKLDRLRRSVGLSVAPMKATPPSAMPWTSGRRGCSQRGA
jgi:hypothetical protein